MKREWNSGSIRLVGSGKSPAVTRCTDLVPASALIGASSVEQLDDNLTALEKLPADRHETAAKFASAIADSVWEMFVDWFAAGINPARLA